MNLSLSNASRRSVHPPRFLRRPRARSSPRLGEELVLGVLVAGVVPDLGDLPALDVENGHVAILERGLALTLGRPLLKNHGVFVVRQNVVELRPERVLTNFR